MPNYYNSYAGTPIWNGGFNAFGQPMAVQNYPIMNMSGVQQNPQYMIQVDGEMAARAWQVPNNLPPKTLIPLWDYDGQHVYFKSTDEYGRMNPMRKARVIFEDDSQNLTQGESGQASGNQSIELPDMTKYVTKDDLESFKQDLRSMFTAQAQQNQNRSSGSTSQNQNGNGSFGNKGGNRG